MRRKGARRRAATAARQANAILEKTGDEGLAIATALKHANAGAGDMPMRRRRMMRRMGEER